LQNFLNQYKMKRINAKRHSAAEKYAECCVPTAISQQMKPLLRKVTTVMLASTLIILFFATNSCDKLRNFRITDELVNTLNPPIPDSVFYIVGYEPRCRITTDGDSAQAYIYLLISENLKDTVYAELPNTFKFPATIVYYEACCGYVFFPIAYRFAYKVQMIYEDTPPFGYSCSANLPGCFLEYGIFLPYFEPKPIRITSITKIQ